MFVKDCAPALPERAFALRNFGVLPAEGLTRGMFAGIPHTEIESKSESPTAYFEDIGPRPQTAALFPLDLCAQFARPAFTPRYDQMVRGFHLVVGDSAFEGMYLWNLGLHLRAGLGRSSLWLSTSLAADQALLARIGKWISSVFWGNREDQVGFIVSSTLDAEAMQELCRVMSSNSGISFSVSRIGFAPYPYPLLTAPIERNVPFNAASGERNLASREQLPVADGKIMIQLFAPPFAIEKTENSGWMADLGIGFRPERYFYTNIRPRWMLPRRLGLAELFVSQGGPQGRVNFSGNPSFEVSAFSDVLEIRVPEDRNIFSAVCFEHRTTNRVSSYRLPARPQRFVDFATSDKGRHLRGLMSLFGTVFHAQKFFSDPFWRRAFYELADRSYAQNFEQVRVRLVKEGVSKWIGDKGGYPQTPEELEDFSQHLATQLTFREGSSTALTFSKLKDLFGKFRGEAKKEGSDESYWTAYERFDALKENELANLVSSRVLMQGLSLRCPHCYTTHWHAVDDLRLEIDCESCLSVFQFPLNESWSFRLNALVVNAIRYHGTTTVLQALFRLESTSSFNGMFQYLPAQDIFEQEIETTDRTVAKIRMKDGQLSFTEGRLFSDLDLLYVSAGRFGVVEVKSSAAGFSDEELLKLKTIASHIRPDDLVLAASGDAWPAEVQTRIDIFAVELLKLGVKVRQMMLGWHAN